MNLPSLFDAKVPGRQMLVPFLIFAALFVALLAGVLLYHGRQDAELDIRTVKATQSDHLLAGEKVLRQEINRLQSDLRIAAHLPGLRYCLNDRNLLESRKHITMMFSAFLRYKPYYFQLRFLDTGGHEIVRVERRSRQIFITDDDELQDKSDRYYFQAMANLGREDIYISPLDLNVEYGKISRPHTPTLRLGMAVFDDQDRKTGFIVLNYQGRELLELYRTVIRNEENRSQHLVNSKAFLVDQDGQYLLAGDPADEWGLFLHHGRTFSRSFPDIWKQMQKEEQGQWLDSRGLLTVQRIRLTKDSRPSSFDGKTAAAADNSMPDDGFHWYLLSHVEPEELTALMSMKRHFHWNIFLSLLPFFLLVSFLTALVMGINRSNRRQLQKQRHNFHILYDQAPLPYQSLDGNGRLLEANRAWIDILGYGADELRKLDFRELIIREDINGFNESFTRLLETGEPLYDYRLKLIRKDGSRLPVSLYCQLRRDPDAGNVRTHGIFIDISELREKEKRIHHLNLILETIIRIHRAIAGQKDLQQLLDECCTILTESRGYPSAWIILLDREFQPTIRANSGLLHDFNGLISWITGETMPPCIIEVRKQRKAITISSPEDFCDRCPMADGYPSAGIMCAPLQHDDHCFGYLTVSLPLLLMQNEKELQRFAELAEDIGLGLFSRQQQQQREQAEAELHKTLQVLEEAQEVARIGSYERNWQNGEGTWSDSTYRIFGYEPGEMACTHEDFLALVIPEDRERVISLLERAKDDKTPFSEDFRITRRDGAVRIIHGTGRTIFDHTGSLLLIRGLFQDVTDQRNMEARILQSEKLATIAGLAAGVAHELNTPLSAILQSIQVIEMAIDPALADNRKTAAASGIDLEGMKKYFKHRQIDYFFQGIRESAGRASSIIRDLLDFSRPRQEQMTEVDINDLIDSSIGLARADYRLKKEYDIINVEFVKEYDPDLPKVPCVAMEIEQVLLNLIKNAVQAMAATETESWLTLRTKQGADTIRIEVEDNGPGIQEEIKFHIFDPFFTSKEVGQGTGLGLSIAYSVIHDKHRGTIEVVSTPGRGATFIIHLPTEQVISGKEHAPRM